MDVPYTVAGHTYNITCLSVGNPHCVSFVEDVDQVPLETVGPLLECAEIFPRRANVSFVSVEDETTLNMRVWERGIGETWACGTAACAVVAESEVAFVLAEAYLEKFGRDNMADIKAAVKAYRQRLRTMAR